MLSTNTTPGFDDGNYSYIEPVPDWSTIYENVGKGFIVFNITGICFLILHVFCILLLSRLCKRYANQRFLIVQVTTVALFCVCLGVCLALDPYDRWHHIPVFLNNILEQVADPCIIVSFISMQNSLINMTSIRVSWNKFQTLRRIIVILCLYIGNLVTLEYVIYFDSSLISVRLLTKFEFVIFSIYSCLCYLCTGFKAAIYLDYIKSPMRGSDQILIDYPSDTEADSRCLIGITSESQNNVHNVDEVVRKESVNLRPVYSSTDSSNGKDELAKSRKTQKYRRKQRKHSKKGELVQELNSSIKLKNLQVNKMFKENMDSLTSLIQETNATSLEFLETSSKTDDYNSLKSTDKPMILQRQLSGCDQRNYRTPCRLFETNAQIEKGKCILLYKSVTNRAEDQQMCADAKVPSDSSEIGTASASENGSIPVGDNVMTIDDGVSSGCDSMDDNGYLADGENVNVVSGKGNSSDDGDSIFSHFNQFKEHNLEILQTAGELPSTCSLIRIRQCAMLQKLITVAYFITFTVIVNTIFHLYSIFGVYGIFGAHRTPKPWPWFLFQLIHRLIELTLAVSLLFAVIVVFRYKPRRKKFRPQSNKT